MNENWKSCLVAAAVLTVSGCSAKPAVAPGAATSAGTATPMPTLVYEPTRTPPYVQPTQRPTPGVPSSIPGIDEPVAIGDCCTVQLLEVFTRTELMGNPPSDGHVYLGVLLIGEGMFDFNPGDVRLFYQDHEYELIATGIRIGDEGKYEGVVYTFEPSTESELDKFDLRFAENVVIDLAPLFEVLKAGVDE